MAPILLSSRKRIQSCTKWV